MSDAIELHDSEIERLSLAEETLVVTFSEAYVHRSSGEPGLDAGDGYLQPVQLIFMQAVVTGHLDLVGTLSDGKIYINGNNLGLIPIPFETTGDVVAEFLYPDGNTLYVTSKYLNCRPTGAAQWLEIFPGA